MAPESNSRPLSVHPAARRRWTPATLIALAGCAALAVGAASMTSTAGAQTRAAGAASPRAQVAAEQPTRAGVLTLRSGTFDLNEQATSLRQAVAQRRAAGADRRLIQLDAPMNPHRRQLLERAGISLGDYVGENTFVADISGARADRLDALGFVGLTAQLQPRMKLDSDIGARPFFTPERQALRDRGESLLMVTLYPDADLDAAIRALDAAPGAATLSIDANGDHATLIVSAPTAAAAALAQIEDVQFIEEAPEATLRNSSARWVIQSNVAGSTPLYSNGLTGAGQVVGVIDSQVDVNHCSFVDPARTVVPGVVNPDHRKILAYNWTLGSASHGTHVAGTAVGDAGTTGDTRGIAYDAKLVYHAIPGFSDGSTGNTFYARLQLHHNQGARVHTNSWGDDGTTQYTGWSNAIDRFSHDNEDSVVMFAVTNGGSLRTPENAKSVLAVGATSKSPNQHTHCTGGAGPTQDGRRKPEIYAPGCSTLSSRWSTSCNTYSASGTSMAAPAIAGATALVRQYFVEGYYPTGAPNPSDALIPTGALMRATVINGGQDMTGVAGYPSNTEGWGRLLADAALHFSGQPRTLQVFDIRNNDPEALSTGLTNVHTVNVTGPGEQLRVTMAFTDAPGAIGAFNPVVNNIDLEVESPSGAIFRGNVFSGGVSTTGGSADAINSVEQVHVNNPEAGTWTIRVIGTAVNSGTQGYAIAATGALANACYGDLNDDGFVDGVDLGLLLGAWGTNDPATDLNASGNVDGVDLGLLLGAWGPCN